MRKIFLSGILLIACYFSFGQTLSNLRRKSIPVVADTVTVDTLSVSPYSFIMKAGDRYIDSSAYDLDFVHSQIIWKKQSDSWKNLGTDSVEIQYRVFSFLLSKPFQNKKPSLITKAGSETPIYYNPGDAQPEMFHTQGLTKSGSISRGITFGNNQDVFVNSSLNLQLSGKLSDNVEILAAITDENIPVQPEGNTQQLQDFDKVFIQVSNNRHRLIAGDFELRRPDSYFMNFYKKGQGVYFTTQNSLSKTKKREMKSGISLAVSKGKTARNTVEVREGNQGPYKLFGNNGEQFIIVLSGTEKVYFNGIQLIRGAQNDYIIDYNTAEVTFSARQLITKDSRIVVEFEYSDKNYARTLLYFNNEFESEKLRIKLNVYSEQDSKNQPLTLDLDSSKKIVMADAGDNLNAAVYPTADSVPFNDNAVLYQKKDTITASGAYTIYVYSTVPDSAYWQVSFTNIGANNGDYVQDITSTNGRVYKWIEPINGIHQGNYAPVTLLITPKQQQLITTGVDYIFDRRNSVSVEGAFSNNDVNLFSSKDKYNDAGFGAKVAYKNETLLSTDTLNGWRLSNLLNYEFTDKDFKPIERFRNVEFERDWNLGTTSIVNDEHISSFQSTLIKPSLFTLTYQLRNYEKGKDYKGLMNMIQTNFKAGKANVVAAGSYLNTDGLNTKTKYLRHSADISRPVWKLLFGLRENAETNRFISRTADTLTPSSFSFNEYGGYINTIDSLKSRGSISFKRRIDELPVNNKFKQSTIADEGNLTTEFTRNPDNSWRTTTTYRVLSIKDTTLTSLEAAKTILNRIDNILNLYNGRFSFNTYYEVGTGQERKQEYYYLRVNDGQGVYDWIDENDNGVQELNEFVVAAFPDRASYIRVYFQTNEYISTRSNSFSEVLMITPAGKSSTTNDNFFYRFSDQLSVRLDRKSQDESLLSSLNPFHQNLADSQLISSNSSVRNIFYYNRTSPVYGADFTWQENKNKSLLTSGFETRLLRSRTINFRWNIVREILFNGAYENGERVNTSDFFSNRNYRINSNRVEPKITYQPGTNFRITSSYEYGDKINTDSDIREHAISNKFQIEVKYTTLNTGNISAKVSLIDIKYNAPDNSFLAYEMLEGFKNGKNLTWGAQVQRTIGNSIQMSLTYDGRKLTDSPIVHTGGMQFRAFF
jgi:hypothetical protein